jgi:hypothetical protein
MTSKGLGEMVEDDLSDTCAQRFLIMSLVDERVHTGSEDPHRLFAADIASKESEMTANLFG